jgi:chromosome segregation ATPase
VLLAVCAADDKITELLDSLEMQKDESIERTFKGVAKHFREVFAELVPGGKGELVMIKRRQVRTYVPPWCGHTEEHASVGTVRRC